MKAAWYERNGNASDVLQVGKLDRPKIEPGKVLVRVHATGTTGLRLRRQPPGRRPAGQGMVRRLTPLWAGLIATGGLIVGMLLTYFVMASWQRRIEEKIERLPQALPLQVQPEALPPPPVAGSGSGHQKTHGGHSAASKPKTPQAEPVPATPATEQP